MQKRLFSFVNKIFRLFLFRKKKSKSTAASSSIVDWFEEERSLHSAGVMVMEKKRARRVEKEEEEERERGNEFAKLPKECILHVFSFATPRDSCRSAVVSKAFLSCTGTDALWERFLPSDYAEILSRAVNPVSSPSSKKELYFGLCKPPSSSTAENWYVK